MRVLALDTTDAAGSVALVEAGRVVDERRGDPSRTHAQRLPGDLLALLGDRQLTASDVDLFAVASGPGSFTGLRIGIATMQGLALVGRRPLVGVSALDALAHLASADRVPGTLVAAWIDAHRREVFAALYRVRDAWEVDEVDGATVGDPAATLSRWRAMSWRTDLVVGDGAVLYGEIIRQVGAGAIVEPPPIAGAIGRLAAAQLEAGAPHDPASIRPLYVRRPDAEIARDAARHGG